MSQLVGVKDSSPTLMITGLSLLLAFDFCPNFKGIETEANMIWLVLHTHICIPLLWFKFVFLLRKNDSEQLCRKYKRLCGGISIRCVGL